MQRKHIIATGRHQCGQMLEGINIVPIVAQQVASAVFIIFKNAVIQNSSKYF